jgi:hypothetical protein
MFSTIQGNARWERTIGGPSLDQGRSVQQTTDGGFILVGSTDPKGADKRDVYLVKTDNRGNLEWWRTYGGI